VHEAIDIGQRLEDFQLAWLEDVTTCDDYRGLARVTERLTTPITGGEDVYGITPFRHMLEARSVDIVMIDLCRVGGITQWMKVAGMAEAFNLPVVSHLLPRDSSASDRRRSQRSDRRVHAIDRPPLRGSTAAAKAVLEVPSRPGLGLSFAREIDAPFLARLRRRGCDNRARRGHRLSVRIDRCANGVCH
jgi:hypothetical protein